jgi:excisionase family DNA binding protein
MNDISTTAAAPIFRLLPPQKVAGGEQIAPLQYTIADTARLLSHSRRTVERLIERGELESVGTGRLRRVPYDTILAYLHRHRNES